MEKLSYTVSLPNLLLNKRNQAWTSAFLWHTGFPNLKLFLKLFTECITAFQTCCELAVLLQEWPHWCRVHQSPSHRKICFGSATALLTNPMFIWLPKINYILLSESLLFKNKSLFLDFICLNSLFYRAQLINFIEAAPFFLECILCHS